MTAYLIRRLLLVVFVVWGALTLLFFLYFLLPGDPATIIGGGNQKAITESTREAIEARYGFDQPVMVQYGRFMRRAATFDFGESYINREQIGPNVARWTLASVRLTFWAILTETVIGIGAGILSAVRRASFADALTTISAVVLSAIPVFVLGGLLQQTFGVYASQHAWLSWAQLPVQGIGPDTWTLLVVPTGSQWTYLVLPAITLAAVSTAIVARMLRTTMLDVNKMDYIRTARAKGLTDRQVTFRHGLRNAMIPVVTLIGIDIGVLFGSAILTETVFNWPGLGSAIAEAGDKRDLPVLLAASLVVVLAYAIVNLAVDLSYAWFDPRIRITKQAD